VAASLRIEVVVTTVPQEKVNILLVDDQPAKLLSYEVMLAELNEQLIKASSASEAFAHLLKTDVAVVLIDVCMPELDGFQLATMIREHPRFQKTAIIFVSAVQFSEVDHVRGYEIGAVDYVSVPVVPEVLRAKVKVFIELHRKTRELEKLNLELERRVVARTFELEAAAARLIESERQRSLALSAGNMGSWHWDVKADRHTWDEGLYRIYDADPATFVPTLDTIRQHTHPDDLAKYFNAIGNFNVNQHRQLEFRIIRDNKEIRWCFVAISPTHDAEGNLVSLNGVTVDITERKQAENKQALLAREVDHRAKNALSVVQAILRLTRAPDTETFIRIVEGRVRAFAATHKILSATRWEGANLQDIIDEEMAPYRSADDGRVTLTGPHIMLKPASAQSMALVVHELATNAAKYGGLSRHTGGLQLKWVQRGDEILMTWVERGGPEVVAPRNPGFGFKIIRSCIEEQMNGTLAFAWDKEGMACTFTIPTSQIVETLHDVGRAEPETSKPTNGHAYPGLTGKRILVVEDESLVSMFMEQVIEELGAGVIGPISCLSDGFSAAESEVIDGAILDLNLGGSQTYPLAEILTKRGVPFVFLTGYGAESIDRRYAHIPILQKPIESSVLKDTLVTLAANS